MNALSIEGDEHDEANRESADENEDISKIALKMRIKEQLISASKSYLVEKFGIKDIHEHLREKTTITWDYSNNLMSR